MVGVIDLSTNEVETPEQVAARIERALPYVDPADVIAAPDCGMKYLPREVAFAKLQAFQSRWTRSRSSRSNRLGSRSRAISSRSFRT